MTLSYTKPGFFIEGKINSAHLNPNQKSLIETVDIFTTLADIECLSRAFVVSSPGEFEVNDITVYCYKLNQNTKESFDTVKTIIEDISILYLIDAHDKLKAEDIEMLGDIHIVILDLEKSNLKNILDSIREIEPHYLIVTRDTNSYDDFSKEVGGNVEEIKKLKLDSKDFSTSSEESSIQMKIVCLS